MAELKRLVSSRRGFRAHLTKLLQSLHEILTDAQPLTYNNVGTLRDLYEQLQRKQQLISELDVKILEATTTEEEIEEEVLQSEEINSSIYTAKAKITQRLTPTTSASVVTPPWTDAHTSAPTPVHEHFTRLPKLEIPKFAGNPLHWQSFWDCFEAAVHSNPSLTGVQKLSYLRAQLHGDAARVIAGFQLNNDNYAHLVALLTERYRQTLIDLPSPSNSLSSLCEFYDATEGHIRSLSSLGKPEDSYGSLLVPILLGKLPLKTKQNLVRSHSKKEWSITELQAAIHNEVHILEMGSESHTPPTTPTASVVAASKKSTPPVKSKPRCPFCAGPHAPSLCDSVKDPKQRCEIVRQNRLCFNCLGHHKVSLCNSRHRCHHCQHKHHTSLCASGQDSGTPSDQSVYPTMPSPQSSTLTSALPQNNSVIQPVVATSTNPSNTTNMSMTIPAPQNNVCLLKTAVATVRNGDHQTKANLLFDEGSQWSFIMQDLAKTLVLMPLYKEDVTVSSFGAQCQLNREVNVALTTGTLLETTLYGVMGQLQ